MSRILLTGSTGFVGIPLTAFLIAQGHEVYRFMRFHHPRYHPEYENTITGDITDYQACKLAVKKANPDTVVHLAAIATTDQLMYDHPLDFTHVILDGTINMVNAFGSHPVSKDRNFIYASSSEVYGQQTVKTFTEELEPHPNNVYSYSKYAGEMCVKNDCPSHGLQYMILRNFNTYGNTHYFRTLIDKCVRFMLSNPDGTLHLGDPDIVRNWQFIDDHVSAYLTCIDEVIHVNETFNFTPGVPYKISQTVDIIEDVTDFTGNVEYGKMPPRPHDTPYLNGSSEKAKRLLGWEPKFNLRQGLETYVERLGYDDYAALKRNQ